MPDKTSIMNTENIYTHNDVTETTVEYKKTYSHIGNKFPAFTPSLEEKVSYIHQLYVTPGHGIRVLLHLHFLAYIIVNPQGVVIGKKIKSFDEAIKEAEAVDREYARWLVEHTFKGMPKSKFINDVKANKLQAKLVSCSMKGREMDTEYYPLVKRKGVGSIDVYRAGNGYSALFYINDMTMARMVYTDTELLIYKSGLRIYNENEIAVLSQWETMRDRKAEMLDVMTDSYEQFWRKKCFLEEKGCGHLLVPNYDGLVMEDTLRGELFLKYEIKHNS